MALPTVLIGLDGATFTVLDPLMERGVMPFLALRSTERGVRAPLRTVMPPLTPPAWTSLMTGKRPGPARRLRLLPEGDPDSRVLPPGDEPGHPQPDDLVAGQRGRQAHRLAELPADVPPAGRRRLASSPAAGCRGASCGSAATRRACSTGSRRCRASSPARWRSTWSSRRRRSTAARRKSTPTGSACTCAASSAGSRSCGYLLSEDGPADLVGIIFDGTDKLQHLCWRFIDPACRPSAPDPWERRSSTSARTTSASSTAKIEQIVATRRARGRPSSWPPTTASDRPAISST